MIFPVALQVLSQMLDPAGEKCDLHIRAAGIFFMQLELFETQRLVALCHNEATNLDEDRILATADLFVAHCVGPIRNQPFFAFTVVPQMQFHA